MMKSAAKIAFMGMVAAAAIALSIAPSEAAKKRAAAKPACTAPAVCSTNCSGGWCQVFACGVDGKWYPAILTPVCLQPFCANVRKKC